MTVPRATAALIAAALLLAGAGGAYVVLRRNPPGASHAATEPAAPRGGEAAGAPAPAAAPSLAPGGGPLPDVAVPLTPDAVRRAGITVEPVATAAGTGELRLPGIVEPNGYRQVEVTALLSGRLTRVTAALGDRVRRGQELAQIHSPELADAQTRYVSARAMLDAHDRELHRTQKLVEIGAASRQELERIHAEHSAQTAAVESARSQLELLSIPSATIEALTTEGTVSATAAVRAPAGGVITERTANAGQTVDAATKLFSVVDLSTVWIVGDVYPEDFSRIRVGSDAAITTAAYPDLALTGRVSYIDPQVNPVTRTAKVRVEVPNPREQLRLGMYVDVVIADRAAAPAAMIPRAAVQHVGDRTVVYLATSKQAAAFIEREVRLGGGTGDRVPVVSGVQAGDLVVTQGSFFLRAERERLGLRRSDAAAPSSSGPTVQSARVVVDERGFQPARVTLAAGQPARLTVVRTTDKTCATEVVIPSLGIRRALPLNEAVTIELAPASGEIAFACGMDMLKGVIVLR